MMKKLGFILAITMLANSVTAETPGAFSNIAISAAEAGSTVSWTLEKSVSENAQIEQIKLLTETTDALNEKLNAKLEKSLEDKFKNQLDD